MFYGIAIVLVLMVLLLGLVYAEARRTQWSLFEALLATAILGHVLVVPLTLGINAHVGAEKIAAIVVLSVATACGMSYGAAWVFGNLAALHEKRTSTRLFYILLGLLFIPSLLAIPFNLIGGWFIWIPLISLHNNAETQRNILEIDQNRAKLEETFFPKSEVPKQETV